MPTNLQTMSLNRRLLAASLLVTSSLQRQRMTSFLHDRVRQLLFVDEMPSASTTSVENADRWIDPNTQLFRIDALYDAAQHDFNAVGDESFQFYIDYARFVQRLSKQCQLSSATAAPAAPVPMIDRLCSLLTVTATLDNVCRSLYCVRYRVRVAPKKLREVLARFSERLRASCNVSAVPTAAPHVRCTEQHQFSQCHLARLCQRARDRSTRRVRRAARRAAAQFATFRRYLDCARLDSAADSRAVGAVCALWRARRWCGALGR
jgi:hypothetical protein